MYLTASNPICKHPIQQRSLKMAPRMSKDSDTMSRASTLQGIATTDFAPRTAHKTNEFIALQTLLETPEIQATVSASSNTSETLVESQSTIKRNKRRTVYWIVGLTTFASLIVLAAILGVILGPRRVSRHSARQRTSEVQQDEKRGTRSGKQRIGRQSKDKCDQAPVSRTKEGCHSMREGTGIYARPEKRGVHGPGEHPRAPMQEPHSDAYVRISLGSKTLYTARGQYRNIMRSDGQINKTPRWDER
ncbi:hypothetical protein D6D20_05159 [Aureobasidium pullulans]|uniref:Uncharacterized protein n=2 Tax=Aureobasidium pullulans TaxID=5580 RepID=A0A4S8Z0X9_AURPU|nr:hypothetical protein D6D20_05159 [Aureobasidium pullulans]